VDGHGHFDLAVAAFGWHLKGEMALLRNHTVDWGTPVFERTRLDPRAGAIHLVPADIDGDGHVDLVGVIAQEHESVVAFLGDGKGDLDIVASASTGVAAGPATADLPSLVWLEQTRPGTFVRHTIAVGTPMHATLDVGDVDGDGDVDIVTGIFRLQGTSDDWLEIWENQTRTPASRRAAAPVGRRKP